ncbi:MAG: hypothetical protein M0P12_05245 [Paludibacteraceae bacterium]|nr:hypothetical protein [Paludibacteraceae bacterium]
MLWILFFISLFLSWVITYIIRKWAIKKRLLDMPNQRSYHTKITPLGGGIAIVACWYMCISFLYAAYPELMPDNLFNALIPGILLLIIGVKDDAIQLSPWIRLITQTVAILISMYFLGGLSQIDFGAFSLTSPLIVNTLAFIAFLWYINLFNFYDGIDGNLGTESISICIISLLLVFPDNPLIFLVACIGGFLKLNWQKAKIFMGDAGSTFLGFNFAVFGIYFQNEHNVSIVLWVMVCMVAIFDTSYTLIRRIIYKENVLTPHKNQMFHRLVSSGFSHQQVVIIQQCLNLFVIAGVWYAHSNPLMIIPASACIIAIFLIYAYWVEKRYPWQKKNSKNKVQAKNYNQVQHYKRDKLKTF